MLAPRISYINSWPFDEVSPLDLNREGAGEPPITPNSYSIDAPYDSSVSQTNQGDPLLFREITQLLMDDKSSFEMLGLRAKTLQSIADWALTGLRKERLAAEKAQPPVPPSFETSKTYSDKAKEFCSLLRMKYIRDLDTKISQLCSARIELSNLLAHAQENLRAGKSPREILADSKVSDGWMWFLQNLSIGWRQSFYANPPIGSPQDGGFAVFTISQALWAPR